MKPQMMYTRLSLIHISAVGLSNTEAIGGYMLTDSLTPRQFSELVDLDFELAQLLYSAYACLLYTSYALLPNRVTQAAGNNRKTYQSRLRFR